ncbi:AMIN-like domain-containing (lipo)protein [Angustibacter luteus]|uniref:AMIN-like domain-containing protein n=1 Tax=Angustibacter luteus TaxID=658456 RepID=A0ABW1JG09_9ACTN
MKLTRTRALLAVPFLAAAAALTVVAAPTSASAATCSTAWGSLAKSHPAGSHKYVTGVRAGRHACYDRVVVDLAGRAPGYNVRYVSAVTMDGSGKPVPLRGGARLQVTVVAPSYDTAGHPTYRPANQRELVDAAGYRTLRQVAWAGTFEGYTTLGVGVRARLPFRVFTLAGPGSGSRLVIDVAHTW